MKGSASLGASVQKAQVPSGKLAGTTSVAVAHTTIAALRRHSGFDAAKAGDPSAALQLVRDLTQPAKIRDLATAHPGAVVVPVLAVERTGVNMLPLALAEYMAAVGEWTVERGILQSNKTHHTDANAVHRLLYRPEFVGAPVVGARYIVVDDVITTGSTVQALRLHLERHGASVVAFSALAGSFNRLAGSSLQIALSQETLDAIEIKFGHGALTRFLRETQIARNTCDLTNSQARYLLSFRGLDTIRARLASAYDCHGLAQDPQSTLSQLTLALAG